MLSVCSRLTEDHWTCWVINRLTKTVYRLTIGLHIKLLQMCRETAQCLGIGQYSCCRIAPHVALIYTDQCIQHFRVLQQVLVGRSAVNLCRALQKLCEYFRSESQGQNSAADCGCGRITASDVVIHEDSSQIRITLCKRRCLTCNS